MNFNEWVTSLPKDIMEDSLWKMEAYRLGLFAAEIGWHDVTELMKDKRTHSVADQMYRSLGSMSANFAEGYSHHTGRARAQYYQYALGSARESRDWYYKAHYILKEEVVNHRITLITQVIKLLLVMVPQQRGKTLALREEKVSYGTEPENLLEHIPF